ncbi:MAG: hypothetical protein HGA47_09350, partial [Zoogloea sp.]|nr:hypothetical protein [Zoogloea sp.]
YPSAENGTDALDLIVCRNVLMYFRPEQMRAVTARLARCLVEGGWLIVSPVEVHMVAAPGLQLLRLPRFMLFRKTAMPRTAAPSPPETAIVLPSHAALALPVAPEIAPPPEMAPAAASAAALAGQSREFADQGRLDEALAWCELAVAADRLDPATTYLCASILLERGDTEAAMAALKRTLYIDHEHLPAIFSLAGLLAAQGRQRDAQRHFRHALALLGKLPSGHILPGSDGITAGRLKATIETILGDEVRA